jgi:hypothetical protein
MEFTIDSHEKWNHTGFLLEAAVIYRLSATGQWTDWYIVYGPDGGESGSNLFLRLSESLRRQPKENWFALIGAVGEDESTAFLIGSSKPRFTAPCGGELTCYANDVSFAYFNNHGTVRLTIEKV